MIKMKKLICLILASLMLLTVLAACGDKEEDNPVGPGGEDGVVDGNTPGGVETDPDWGETEYDDYIPPPTDITADLTIMMWSGDNSYMTDIGNKNYAPEDIGGQNQAAAYAVAKEFNKIYPNVKINIFAKSGDPNSDGIMWAQHIENFRAEHGKYPDFYAATDIPGDIMKGMCADLSIFENDPVYRSFNKGILMLANYEGKQFALPQYLLPWGVFVNRSLANANNIDVPDPDWTIAEYTAFVTHSDPDNGWFGAMDAPLDFLRTGSKDFAYNLTNRTGGSFVNLASDNFFRLLEYIPRWSNHAAYPQNDLGNAPEGFMDEHWWWPYRFFQMGRLLTLDGDPWMMGDLAHPDPGHWGAGVMSDWDIYPRPATSELGNTVGVVFDPFAIHNYFADPNLSDEEAYEKLQIAYEFAKFWCADTRAWKARAEQMFLDGDNLKTCLNDSLPMVTGAAFDEQMAIWYTTETHARFADKSKMPGWHLILDLWQAGEIWDVSDKAYPWRFERDGSVTDILFEFYNSWNPDISGARRTDANWLDQMKSLLPDWNAQFNARWEGAFNDLSAAINRYYS